MTHYHDEEHGGAATLNQWVVSLAISIVCCAVLFIVFAGYIFDLNSKTAFVQVRLEAMQDRQIQLANEVDILRHPVVSTIQMPMAAQAVAPVQPVVQNAQPQAQPQAVYAPPADANSSSGATSTPPVQETVKPTQAPVATP